MVEGPLSDVLHFSPNNKPRLPLHLSNLIDTAVFRNETTKTNLQEFHRQLKEKGITPSMTVLCKEKDIIILGTALLDKHAQYLFTIDSDETKLLYILKHQTSREFPFTLKMPMASLYLTLK
ncbi:hypothetical protein LQV63_11705 [Paenibacillus profundus]|uniref:Spore germination protein N-terminal domain-containing protein n=1 Tax=Paenibacillus profundus TaxID=1173085 RepID=A0ABS8YHE9_9BACL|nr:hypothetical protein [Paenibacillus profundus]